MDQWRTTWYCIPQFVVMYGLGFNIGIVYSVERDGVVRKVAEAMWACVQYIEPRTIADVHWSVFDWNRISFIIGVPPCIPWSARSDCAMGFGDPVSKVSVAVARVVVKAHKANRSIKQILGNVMVDPRLVADMAIQEGYVEGEVWT